MQRCSDAPTRARRPPRRPNLEEADRAPDLVLNEMIWKAIRDRDAVMPPPVRAAFVQPLADDDQEDE